MAQRGLHAGAVENLTLDLRSLHRLVADELDPERFLVVDPDVPERANELAGPQQKFLFQRL